MQRREFTKRETEALELWRGLLEDGGANIKTTDHVDAVRYAKVSMDFHIASLLLGYSDCQPLVVYKLP